MFYNFYSTCELLYFLTLNESILTLVLIQIIMEAVTITSAAQAGKTPRILWSPVFNVFSSVCILHVSPVVSLPRSCCFASNKQNCPVFEPIPSFLCVHVDVEMTSVVELFSGRFGFSVKSGMLNWPVLPLQNTCTCCMRTANQSLHTASHPRLILLLSYCFTNLSRCSPG